MVSLPDKTDHVYVGLASLPVSFIGGSNLRPPPSSSTGLNGLSDDYLVCLWVVATQRSSLLPPPQAPPHTTVTFAFLSSKTALSSDLLETEREAACRLYLTEKL